MGQRFSRFSGRIIGLASLLKHAKLLIVCIAKKKGEKQQKDRAYFGAKIGTYEKPVETMREHCLQICRNNKAIEKVSSSQVYSPKRKAKCHRIVKERQRNASACFFITSLWAPKT